MKTTTTERLRQARVRAGLSARALSLRAGLSHSLVAMIESGLRGKMSADTAAKLARELGISVEWLIRGDSIVPEPTTPPLPASNETSPAKESTPASSPRRRRRSPQRGAHPSLHAWLGALLVQLCVDLNVSAAAVAQRWGVEVSYVHELMAGTRPWTVEDVDRLPTELFDGITMMWRVWRGLDADNVHNLPDHFWRLLTIAIGACAQAFTEQKWADVVHHAALVRTHVSQLEAFARTQSCTAFSSSTAQP